MGLSCPTHLGQDVLVLDDVLVGGDEHIELAAAKLRHQRSPHGRCALFLKKASAKLSRPVSTEKGERAQGQKVRCLEMSEWSRKRTQDMTDLICNLDNGWCPLVELIHPVGESAVENEKEGDNPSLTIT